MGVINVTPDSFYDGGQFLNEDRLMATINDYNEMGVQMIDIGAESSRPGSMPLSCEEEISRLSPILNNIRKHTDACLSVDTYKYETAQFSLDQGVDVINDISGGESDDLLNLIADYNAGIILMHKKGSPKTMQDNPIYEDVVSDVKLYLSNQIKKANSAGIKSIIIDPGIGFGKSLDHNLALLSHLDHFQSLGCPIMVGTSNKSFIGHLTGADTHQRLPGSLASVIAAYQKGAKIFRVHNVKETIQALDVFRAIYE